MRISDSLLAAVVACGLLVVSGTTADVGAQSKPDFSTEEVESIAVAAKRIAHFSKSDASKTRFGKLAFRGGLELTSPSSKFGGFSAFEIDPDGKRFLALSDAGVWLTGTLGYDNDRPSAITDAKIGALTGIGGAPLIRDRDRDAEGVVLLEGSLAGGAVLISFEQNHRIGRFPITERGVGAPTAYLPLPAGVKRQSSNKSLESLCILRGGPQKGAIVTLSERFPDRTGTRHMGWMLAARLRPSASNWSTLAIRNIGDFDLTDCRGLPDGSLIVLERRFRWSSWYEGVKMRLRRFSPSELVSSTPMEGEVLLEADMGYEIDNMEGLSVHRSSKGETILTLISDNNFSRLWQRTVLLQFALDGAAVAEPAGQMVRNRQ